MQSAFCPARGRKEKDKFFEIQIIVGGWRDAYDRHRIFLSRRKQRSSLTVCQKQESLDSHLRLPKTRVIAFTLTFTIAQHIAHTNTSLKDCLVLSSREVFVWAMCVLASGSFHCNLI